MTKKLIWLLGLSLLISSCTINYDNFNDSHEESTTPEEIPDPVIEEDALFYPSSLTLTDTKITQYDYRYYADNYEIYSAYYSEKYDTIYIAYDYTDTASTNKTRQSLKAKDLYEIEKHALTYFTSDSTKSEYKKYIKAVRIYPDRLASACRKGTTDDVANQINGCADYGGKEAIIDLNATTSLNDFYNPKKEYLNPFEYIEYEPMRDTFAHEYGHVSTFYHMAYKSDENYEDYLKLRLGTFYNTIYPNGLPDSYSSDFNYSIQPEEILADDFVELFYNTTTKDASDNYEYELNYDDLRNSLDGYDSIQNLKENETLYNQVKKYYETNFLDNNITNYNKPKVISKTDRIINYYESYSKINDSTNVKTITSKIDVNLIAVGEITYLDTKYYRVILSNTFKVDGSYNQKDVGKKMGYVKASDYTINTTMKLYSLNRSGSEQLESTSILPIKNSETNKLYVLPFYDFAYIIAIEEISSGYAKMYDYLQEDLSSTQTYEISTYSFGTLLN